MRDFFLLLLCPNFQSTTGETFNREGKVDILIRHEKKNVFVAEFKYWSGAKGLQSAIDQILGYLTYRDSKTALVVLVQNQEMKPVLDQIAPTAAAHSCHVKSLGRPAENWFDFEFFLPQDKSRSVRLAIICFHLLEPQ